MTNLADQTSGDHARLMDRMYRYQRHIYDLTRKYYLLGRDKTIREMGAKPGDSILELGCGTGRNLKLIAKTYPQCTLSGLDISEEMLVSARKSLPGSATLVAGDASTFKPADFGVQGFDHILISYALSMIPPWQKTIKQAVAALNPGGTLHIVDFGQQERLPKSFRAALQAWLASFHVTPRANLESVVEEIALQSGAQWTFTSLYRDYARRATIRKPLD